uniref:DUF3467 domain-containing protein n=1 Tax=Schlesneria paludicola TaxID=360056 RepID=A0A7C4QRX5_9PLAN
MTDENGNAPERRPQPQPMQPIEEPAGLQPIYANFCRVASTPEELVLDFGLNTHPFGGSTEPVKVSQRLVVNYYTAKRMWAALGVALQRHEQTFGVIETDVNKRAAPTGRPAR